MATNAQLTSEILRQRAEVRRGISERVANDVRKRIIGVSATPYYQQEEGPEYPFEALDSEVIKGAVNKTIEDWYKVRSCHPNTLYLDYTDVQRMA